MVDDDNILDYRYDRYLSHDRQSPAERWVPSSGLGL